MQQTEHLKLNLIETGDPLSPAPINENADRIEAALLTKTAESRTDGLEQRVITLEGRKMAYGSYTGGTDSAKGILLGFTPGMVVVKRPGISVSLSQWVALPGAAPIDPHGTILQIIDGGFKPGKTMNNSCNDVDTTYWYFAIG